MLIEFWKPSWIEGK